MTSRIDDPRIQATAAAIRELSDPVRLAVVDVLTGGARSASQLADELAIAAPRLANHLTRLRGAGIVTVTRSGRHAVYRLADPHLAQALSALQGLVPADRDIADNEDAADHASPAAGTALAEARTCYDHLAGRLGVALFDHLVSAGALLPPADGQETELEVGPAAAAGFAALGVDLTAPLPRRRKPATACLDWTERRPHLGGALGAAVLDSALQRDWLRTTDGRALQPTTAGRTHLPCPSNDDGRAVTSP